MSHNHPLVKLSRQKLRIHPVCTLERQEEASEIIGSQDWFARSCVEAVWARLSYLLLHLATACVLTAALMLAGGCSRVVRMEMPRDQLCGELAGATARIPRLTTCWRGEL